MTQDLELSVNVNGQQLQGHAEARTTLADFLRDELGLTGTHLGCEHGVCGACTVLMEGRTVRSCLMLAVQAHGRAVTTVEGLASPDGSLHPVQQAFSDKHGLQCGFCTPGFLMAVTELLADEPDPDEDTIRAQLSGNICRCTGYQNIVDAVRAAAERMRGEQPEGVVPRAPANLDDVPFTASSASSPTQSGTAHRPAGLKMNALRRQ